MRLISATLFITALILGLMISAAYAQVPGIPDTSAVMRDIQNQASGQVYDALRSMEYDRLRWYWYPYSNYYYYWGRPVIIPTPIPRTQPRRGTPGAVSRLPVTVVFPP